MFLEMVEKSSRFSISCFFLIRLEFWMRDVFETRVWIFWKPSNFSFSGFLATAQAFSFPSDETTNDPSTQPTVALGQRWKLKLNALECLSREKPGLVRP